MFKHSSLSSNDLQEENVHINNNTLETSSSCDCSSDGSSDDSSDGSNRGENDKTVHHEPHESSSSTTERHESLLVRRVLKLLNLTPERFPSERLAWMELKSVFDMNAEPFVMLKGVTFEQEVSHDDEKKEIIPSNNNNNNNNNDHHHNNHDHSNSMNHHEVNHAASLNNHDDGNTLNEDPFMIISKQHSEYLQQIGRTLSYILSRVFKEKKCYHRRDLPTIWIEARKLFFDYCHEIDPSLSEAFNVPSGMNHKSGNSEFLEGDLPCHYDLKSSSQSLLNYLRVIHLENCWKLYCEELWCRLYQFTDYSKFSEVPSPVQVVNQEASKTQNVNLLEEIMQFIENDSSETNKSVEKMSKKEMKRLRNKMLKDAKKQNKASSSDNQEISEEKALISQQDWLSKKNGFFMSKQCLDNVRYFVWGYHHAFESDWYMKDILDLHFSQGTNPFSRYNNIVLLDLDNVGQSIFLLKERNFDYGKDCLMIGVAGPKYSTSLRVSEEVLRERESSLHFVKIRMLEENGCIGMNAFEKYLYDFYDRGYFKKYKDAADYLLGCLAGALHRVTDIRTRIFIVSKDDGLRHIQKSLIIRGRHSYLVTSQESLMYTLDNYLFSNDAQWDRLDREIEPTLTKFHSLSLDDLSSAISEQTSSHIIKNESINIDELSDSKVSEEEKMRVYCSITGVSFDREVHEKILGDYILEYYEKESEHKMIRIDSIRIKGRR